MDLLTVPDVAEKLHISACTVRRLVKDQKIKFRRIGRLNFFTEGDLSDFLESCTVPRKNQQLGGTP